MATLYRYAAVFRLLRGRNANNSRHNVPLGNPGLFILDEIIRTL
ncbi:hypothetical protein [Streptomyces endophytica]|uniref:Transposase n=1 Tax=Streptomyces endophytica TaxID=2991496 RepID=A0ABY6PK20_9ACTN|nr:hypothetical protein [Streptomyces endophytica]UZJ33492.1 hypothetical protein OJ254_28470 [Streptomyces endophytica]